MYLSVTVRDIFPLNISSGYVLIIAYEQNCIMFFDTTKAIVQIVFCRICDFSGTFEFFVSLCYLIFLVTILECGYS